MTGEYAVNFWRGDDNIGGAWWVTENELSERIAHTTIGHPQCDRVTASTRIGGHVRTWRRDGDGGFVEVRP